MKKYIKVGYKKGENNHKYKHGGCGTRLHRIWSNMKARCTNKNHRDYWGYGGRSVVLCKEWKNSFTQFRDWAIDNGYEDNLSIDRIDNNGNYEPSNCRWTTQNVQSQNTKLLRPTNNSGYRGVGWCKKRKMYRSRIRVFIKEYFLGYFKTAKEAALAYDTFCIVYGTNHTRNFV